MELAAAPFRWTYLKDPWVWAPLLGVATLSGLVVVHSAYNTGEVDPWISAMGLGVSFNAGVGEEAMFRGYLQPFFRDQYGDGEIVGLSYANLISSAIFGAVHFNETNTFPWTQVLGGLHLGALTERDGWRIGRSIFMHTWWDAILFAGALSVVNRSPAASIRSGGAVAFASRHGVRSEHLRLGSRVKKNLARGTEIYSPPLVWQF